MLRSIPLLLLFLCSYLATAQSFHHYVAAVQGIETATQEKELLHYLRAKDPNGRYSVDVGTGDVTIHTATRLSESSFGQTVNAMGLLLLHFQEVQDVAPRRRRNQRSA
jgi:hypothetical protein